MVRGDDTSLKLSTTASRATNKRPARGPVKGGGEVRDRSVRHQHRNRHVVHEVAGGASEHQLAETRVSVGAHHDQVRTFVGGPIGILLTGASIASLVAVYVKNHETIWARVTGYKTLIHEYEKKYDQIFAKIPAYGLRGPPGRPRLGLGVAGTGSRPVI